MNDDDTAPDTLLAAAARLNWFADHAVYITDDQGRIHALTDEAQEALEMAERINALGMPPLPTWDFNRE